MAHYNKVDKRQKSPFVEERRDAEFYNTTRTNIAEEINTLEWNALLKTLLFLTFMIFLTTSVSSYKIHIISISPIVYRLWIARKDNVDLWYKALDIIYSMEDEQQVFKDYLDRFPKEIKHTKRYKMIRRNHFELLCGLTPCNKISKNEQ